MKHAKRAKVLPTKAWYRPQEMVQVLDLRFRVYVGFTVFGFRVLGFRVYIGFTVLGFTVLGFRI